MIHLQQRYGNGLLILIKIEEVYKVPTNKEFADKTSLTLGGGLYTVEIWQNSRKRR